MNHTEEGKENIRGPMGREKDEGGVRTEQEGSGWGKDEGRESTGRDNWIVGACLG